MQITNEFSPEIIRLEKSRDPSTADGHDLHWCFATSVKFFINDGEAEPLIELPEASLFGLVSELSYKIKDLVNGKPGNYQIDDWDGSFSLMIESDGSTMTMVVSPGSETLTVPVDEFVQSVIAWLERAKKQVEEVFPGLLDNPHYREFEWDIGTE